ncbi:MAG: GTP cyclohydrolase I FolE [Candidatus Shapirobacteria bacterium]|jgi:GTP cyclohydrolase I
MKKLKQTKEERAIRDLLTFYGEKPQRDGLQETPARVIRMYKELLSGYTDDPKRHFKLFDSDGFHNLVTVSNIDFYSLCEHHMIPFYGKVHIGYIPNGKVLGLSKFARLVETFTRRLQTQENITRQLSEAIEENMHPQGLAVIVEAEHLCVSMRGIKKKGFVTTTSVFMNELKTDKSLIDQFYRDIANYSLKK